VSGHSKNREKIILHKQQSISIYKVVQAMYKILSEPHEIYFQEQLINKIHQLI
jgi:hypothetical protein